MLLSLALAQKMIAHHGETPTRINKPRGVSIETTRDRIHHGHLAQRVDNIEHHDTNDHEVDQKGGRTAGGQGTARADEETSTNGASDGNHVQMAPLHGPVELDDAVAVGAGLEAVGVKAQTDH